MNSTLPSVDMTGVGASAAKIAAATPSDLTTVVMYFLIVLIVVSVIERIFTGWRHDRIATKFSTSAENLATVMSNDSTQVTVQLALVQKELKDAADERDRFHSASLVESQQIKDLLTDARDLLAKNK